MKTEQMISGLRCSAGFFINPATTDFIIQIADRLEELSAPLSDEEIDRVFANLPFGAKPKDIVRAVESFINGGRQ